MTNPEITRAVERLEELHGAARMELATLHADIRQATAILLHAMPTNDDARAALHELANDCAHLYSIAITARYGDAAVTEARRISDLSRVLFDLAITVNLDDIPGNVCAKAAASAYHKAVAGIERSRRAP